MFSYIFKGYSEPTTNEVMAIGLVPHHSVLFPIEGLTKDQFLALVLDVAEKLEWNVASVYHDGFIAYTKFRRTSINEKIQLKVEDGLVTLNSETQGGQFIDWGRNKRNTDDLILGYDNLKFSLKPEELEWKAHEFNQKFGSGEESNIQATDNLESTEKSKGLFSLLIPMKGYFVTPVLIDLSILLFVFMVISGVNVISPANESLLLWGANFRPYTLDGQAWRLLTNCFLHIGILHLLFNMYALMYIGILLEPRLGSWRFGIAYILTGIMGSVTSLYIHPITISAGASGAIFGMYGVFLAMLTTNLIEKNQRKALLTSIAIFVGYNLLNGVKGGIDNAAHIGGLVSGIILGYSFYPGVKNATDKKWNYGLPIVLIIALTGFSSWEYHRIPNDIVRYDDQIKRFISMESQAMEVFKLPKSTPKEKLLTELKDRGLYYWNENRNLVITLDKLDLPDQIHKRDKILIAYCDIRIKMYELLYKSVDEDSRAYDDQIHDYATSIDSLLQTLK